ARSTSPVDVSRLPLVARAGSEGAAPGAAGRAAANASSTAAAEGTARAVGAARPPSTAGAPARSPARAPARAASRQETAGLPPTKQAAAKQQPATRSRLVVEPLDTWLDSPVTLRTTSELSSTPPEQASAQRTEAAALWKALNAQPQELAQDGERLKTLEGEMNTLRGQASRDRAAAAQLQQQLEQAEQERFPAIVVYVLGGLLLLALLIVVWTWTRLRSASEKAVQAWRDSVALGNRQAAAAHEAALGLTPHPGDNWEAAETLPTPPGMAP
ncbi:hypothetical protein OSTOST_13282, partial [Ostertagia ostertagi]